MSNVKKIPMRTCVACKSSKPKKELIRIVRTENGIVLDRTGKVNGRGAYVCNSPECMEKIKKAKLLNRAFECAVTEEVYERLNKEFFGE